MFELVVVVRGFVLFCLFLLFDDELFGHVVAQDPAVNVGGGVVKGCQAQKRRDGAVVAGVSAHGDLGEVHQPVVDVLADALRWEWRRGPDGSSSHEAEDEYAESHLVMFLACSPSN